MKYSLKKQIKAILSGVPDKVMTIFVYNPATEEEELYKTVPCSMDLKVTVDSAECAETLLRLRNGK